MGMNINSIGGDYEYNEYPLTQLTADNSVVYTSKDIGKYNYHIVDNQSGEDVDIFVSVDGTNWSTTAAAVTLIDDVTTGGGLKHIEVATTETGIVRGKFRKIQVRMAGDTGNNIEIGEIKIAHGVE